MFWLEGNDVVLVINLGFIAVLYYLLGEAEKMRERIYYE